MSATFPVDAAQAEPVRHAAVGGYRLALLPRAAYEAAYTPGQGVIGFAFDSQSGTHAFGGERRIAYRTRPNSLAFVPEGCDVYSQSRQGGEYLTLVATPPGRPGGAAAERRFNDLIDPAAIPAAHRLRRMLLAARPADPLALEHEALALAGCASRALDGDRPEPPAVRWLTPQRLRHVEELIEARLGGPLIVQDLADALGLSAGFFARAFKAATGQPPHAWILDRRIAHARALLRTPASRDLSAVAYACGFSSHAHMTAAFRSRLGVAPSALRDRAS
jgi:AraC family transcriptional regulator